MKDLTYLTEKQFIELPPSLLSDKVLPIKLCKLSDKELTLFRESLNCLEQYMADNDIKIPEDMFALNLCFVENNEEIILPHPQINLGLIGYHAVYNMTLIRSYVKTDSKIMTVFLEEMAHHFFFCKNEVKVKYLVYECLKYKYPDLLIEDIYNKEVLNE